MALVLMAPTGRPRPPSPPSEEPPRGEIFSLCVIQTRAHSLSLLVGISLFLFISHSSFIYYLVTIYYHPFSPFFPSLIHTHTHTNLHTHKRF